MRNTLVKNLLPLLAFVLFFGCIGVPQENYDNLLKQNALSQKNLQDCQANSTRLYGELVLAQQENQRLSEDLQSLSGVNASFSSKLSKAAASLEAYLFVSRVMLAENASPSLQDKVDVTERLALLSDSSISVKWQSYLECGSCANKTRLEKALRDSVVLHALNQLK